MIAVFGVGALGLFSIQNARIAGAAEIIAVGLEADAHRFRVAQELGADHCCAADQEDVAARVRDITGGERVALVIDAAGPSAVLAQSFSILRNGGKIVRIGYDPEPLRFSLNPMIEKGTWLKGHF